MELQATIWHDGKNWVVEAEGFKVEAPELDELDRKVARTIKNNPDLASKNIKRVNMYFDMMTIPQWMRQYMQHYFSRIIEIEEVK
ncbi:hypothetical protein Thein_0414 [Thermodesulfatator indicus DSM 15286]|uniref:DUF1902 domain-containing protein n=1 Tax=Thermodesulfatator indicus (strain DSM 15286 / JCM 11887 / CIR29812) TaxID=667014 RepID=F8AAM4_THEID|nr:DUF5395 domain-containing protein [Thermodesulfatator indicus]AEH44296.1 hypothetical protein Thein_0414 [Thermodesulfatator indicus DSM 15286]